MKIIKIKILPKETKAEEMGRLFKEVLDEVKGPKANWSLIEDFNNCQNK